MNTDQLENSIKSVFSGCSKTIKEKKFFANHIGNTMVGMKTGKDVCKYIEKWSDQQVLDEFYSISNVEKRAKLIQCLESLNYKP
uniref:Uncharacterized protein n=1 Tax=Pithovirus LCPAC001 TaxID=2506585 RepID=A0A481Z4V7_9VIRU|nr:MAG: hypothetical protein LCPAC001_01830 [Pithovirus LCPAC001]